MKGPREFANQKKNVWSMVALDPNTNDQLRQRVAWALSQILIVTPNQIDGVEYAEPYLKYYDIFVKVSGNVYFLQLSSIYDTDR